MTKSADALDAYWKRQPSVVAVLWSPTEKSLKVIATNALSRYLDDENNNVEVYERLGRFGDSYPVYIETVPAPFENATKSADQLRRLSKEELDAFVRKTNPDFKVLSD